MPIATTYLHRFIATVSNYKAKDFSFLRACNHNFMELAAGIMTRAQLSSIPAKWKKKII